VAHVGAFMSRLIDGVGGAVVIEIATAVIDITTEPCGVVAQPPSFDGPTRVYRRVREEGKGGEESSCHLGECETGRLSYHSGTR
jgi:hypothetical protein